MLTIDKYLLFLFLSLVLISVYTWILGVGGVNFYQAEELPPGQLSYIFSKLFGMLAIIILWLQLCFGLTMKVSQEDVKKCRDSHILFGILTVMTILVHFLLFFTAAGQRMEVFPYSLLLIQFNDYYSSGLAFGQIAVIFSIPLLISGRNIRNRLAAGINYIIHRVSVVIFFLIIIHSYMIGSETTSFLMPYVYIFMLVSVLALIVRRMYVR